jgi:protein-disulfide isomerase
MIALRVLRIAALSAGLAAALMGWGRPAAAADQFTAAQRAEIVRIVREALKQDPSILRDAVTALQADESRQQAAAVAAHAKTLVDPADPIAGNPKGDVTIVEFFDTRCPYCRKLEPTMTALLASDHGIRLVYKDLPILGPASIVGSRALLAAQRQGGYERLRTAIMESPPDVTETMIQSLAEKVGLDWPRLQRDMSDPEITQRLAGDLRLARALGIEGTPALVVGHALIPGAVELAELRKAVAVARADEKASGQ